MIDLFCIVGDTAARMAAGNPVLALCQDGFETDTLRRKVGDGVTAWNDLPYASAPLGALLALFADVAPAPSTLIGVDPSGAGQLLTYGEMFAQLLVANTAAEARALLGLATILNDVAILPQRMDAHDTTLDDHETRLDALEG